VRGGGGSKPRLQRGAASSKAKVLLLPHTKQAQSHRPSSSSLALRLGTGPDAGGVLRDWGWGGHGHGHGHGHGRG
jgi:hypothetical protein